jgi:MOSC domain-containing protein YiiM
LGEYPMRELREVECVAGKGLVGDRFFDHRPHKYPNGYHGQATFIAWETYENVSRELGVPDRPPSSFRRNVVTRGVDLNAWIGREFEIQGIRFLGTEECAPCRWMELAFARGALKALVGRGGLRAKILTSGTLRADAQ